MGNIIIVKVLSRAIAQNLHFQLVFHQNCTIIKFVCFENIFKIIGTFLKLC